MKKLLLLFILLASMLFSFNVEAKEYSNEDSSRGIYANLTSNLYYQNGKVIGETKNNFTLFPSEIEVRLTLYMSYQYEADFSNMTYITSNYIEDLNMGNTISVSANGIYDTYWYFDVYFVIDGSKVNNNFYRAYIDQYGNFSLI